MTLYWYTHAVLVGTALLVLADNIRVRREVKRLKAEAAEIVANALGNSVLIDGVELPKPDDERWVPTKNITVVGKPLRGFRIGPVIVDHDTVWVGVGDTVPMATTEATKKYCSAVWKAYRSRVARKTIETTS